jgi:pilus assembly protein Flp/PilA
LLHSSRAAPTGARRAKEVITALNIPYLLTATLRRLRADEDGQGLAEYALILALIAIVAIVALIFLSSQLNDKLSVVGSTLGDYNP